MSRFLCVKTVVAILVLFLILLIAVFAPLVIPEQAATQMNMRARLLPPSMEYWLGTDNLGRDLFARVILGTRLSILIAVTAVWTSLAIGLPIGVISGYFGGRIDNILMRLVDAFLSFPALLLALTISAVLGPSLPNTILAIGVAFTPFLARIIRGETLRVARLPYVEAARASGTTDLWMIVRHVLPNILPAVIVQPCVRHSCRGGFVFPGAWHTAAAGVMGADDPDLARLSRRCAVDGIGARRCHWHHGAGVERPGGRLARCV